MNPDEVIGELLWYVHETWPLLYAQIDHTNMSTKRKRDLVKLIRYDGLPTSDGIKAHIHKNEMLIEWWIL